MAVALNKHLIVGFTGVGVVPDATASLNGTCGFGIRMTLKVVRLDASIVFNT